MTAHVWIVERRAGGKWRPYTTAWDNKREAKADMRESVTLFPEMGYRVRKYVRAAK